MLKTVTQAAMQINNTVLMSSASNDIHNNLTDLESYIRLYLPTYISSSLIPNSSTYEHFSYTDSFA